MVLCGELALQGALYCRKAGYRMKEYHKTNTSIDSYVTELATLATVVT